MRAWLIASARTTRQKRVQSMTAMAMMTELKPGAEHRDQQDGEEHRRKRHPDVDDARDDAVGPAAEIAGDQPERRADQAGGGGRREGDDEGDAPAIDQPREQVAAEAVGAEPEARLGALHPEGRQPLEHQILGERILRRDQRREDRREQRDKQPAAGKPQP